MFSPLLADTKIIKILLAFYKTTSTSTEVPQFKLSAFTPLFQIKMQHIHKLHTCLLSDTSCVSSCRIVSTPASCEADTDMMSPCSRYMPLGGLRRALSGWWRYWAPMFSFFTGPERLGVALSVLALLGFCFTACEDGEGTEELEIRMRLFFQE